jgi:hypothetical protein
MTAIAGFPSAHEGPTRWIRRDPRACASWRRAGGLAGRVALLLLAAFHAWLFWSHLVSGRLLEPAVGARWVTGVLLTAGFLGLKRYGLPTFRGRKAIVLWLLVALLHAHAAWAPGEAMAGPQRTDGTIAVFVLQAISATALLGAGLALLAVALRQKPRPVRAPAWPSRRGALAATPADGWLLVLAPRPPPLR